MTQALRPYLPWLLLLTLVSILQIAGTYPALRLPLQPFEPGKLYTLLTAHWVHINLRHFLHNAGALVVIMLLVAPTLNLRHWLLALLLTSLIVSLSLIALPHDLVNYAGLSGLLHGLFVAGCLGALRENRWLAGLLLGALAIKLFVELAFDVRLLEDPVIYPAQYAHLYGVLGGLLSAALINLMRKQAQH